MIDWTKLFGGVTDDEIDEALADSVFEQIGNTWFCDGIVVSETIVYDFIEEQQKGSK